MEFSARAGMLRQPIEAIRPKIGSVTRHGDELSAYVFVPEERMAELLTIAQSERVKVISFVGEKLRYGSALIHNMTLRTILYLKKMAEREGFEPSIRFCRILTFQASAFDHSATAPHAMKGRPCRGELALEQACRAPFCASMASTHGTAFRSSPICRRNRDDRAPRNAKSAGAFFIAPQACRSAGR